MQGEVKVCTSGEPPNNGHACESAFCPLFIERLSSLEVRVHIQRYFSLLRVSSSFGVIFIRASTVFPAFLETFIFQCIYINILG